MSDQRKLFFKLINEPDFLLQKESADQKAEIDILAKYGVRKYKSVYLKSKLKDNKSDQTDYIFYKNELDNCFKLPSFNLRYSMNRDDSKKYDNIEVFRNFVNGYYNNSFNEKYNNYFKSLLSKKLSNLVKDSYASAKNYDGVDRHYIESVFDINIMGFTVDKNNLSIELNIRYGFCNTENVYLSRSKTNNVSMVIKVDFEKTNVFNEDDFIKLVHFKIMNCDNILTVDELSSIGLINKITVDGVSVEKQSSRAYFGKGFSTQQCWIYLYTATVSTMKKPY